MYNFVFIDKRYFLVIFELSNKLNIKIVDRKIKKIVLKFSYLNFKDKI